MAASPQDPLPCTASDPPKHFLQVCTWRNLLFYNLNQYHLSGTTQVFPVPKGIGLEQYLYLLWTALVALAFSSSLEQDHELLARWHLGGGTQPWEHRPQACHLVQPPSTGFCHCDQKFTSSSKSPGQSFSL